MAFDLCGRSNSNTGFALCEAARGILKQPFIFNGGLGADIYNDGDNAVFAELARLVQLSKNDPDKIFPFPQVEDIADSSEQNREGTLGLGFKMVLVEGRPVYTLKVFADAQLTKALRKFNNKTVRILELDVNNNLWGTNIGGIFKGFKAKLFTVGNKIATGQNIEEGIATITLSILDTKEYYDNCFRVAIGDQNTDELAGLMDAEGYESEAPVSNVHTIGWRIPTSEMGVYLSVAEKFGSSVADGDLFTAFTGATYQTSLTITSVTLDGKELAFTFSSTPYGALPPGTKIKIIPVAPELLAAAPNLVKGVELENFITQKPL